MFKLRTVGGQTRSHVNIIMVSVHVGVTTFAWLKIMAVHTHRFMRHQAKSNFLLPLPLLLGAGNILFIVWDVGYSRYSFLRGFHEDINDSPLCCCFSRASRG